MTELLTSASQIKLYRECKRKFGWSYLAKIKQPPNEGMLLGIDVDDNQLQPYLREGKEFDYSKESGMIAAAGLAYLPKPMSPGLQVQKHFVFPSPSWETAPFSYQGYEDVYVPDSSAMPECAGGVPCVGDFKTTKSFSYALTTVTLGTDVQAMTYAMHTLFETGAPAVDLVWIYFLTKGPRKVRRVHLRVDANHVAREFSAIDATAVEMFNVRKDFASSGLSAEAFVETLEPNASMCDSYGGCPYRNRCNLSPVQIVNSLDAKRKRLLLTEGPMTTSTVDLLSSLKARKAPVEPVGGASGYEMSKQQLDGQAAADAGVAKAGGPLPGNLPAWATKAPLGINPPEESIPPTAPSGPLVVAAPISLVEPVVAIEKEKSKRGRPAGSKNTPKDPVGADIAAHTAPVVDAYEAAIAKASEGLSEYELRAEAVRDLALVMGNALLKFAAQLEVTK